MEWRKEKWKEKKQKGLMKEERKTVRVLMLWKFVLLNGQGQKKKKGK